MLGDFNESLHNGQRLGGPRRRRDTFVLFSNMIEGCGMMELPSTVNGFTWAGRRYDLCIQCKLDKCFGNKEWLKIFPASNKAFLQIRGSDHRPVLVNIMYSQKNYRDSFRFDRRMLHKYLVREAVVRAWNFPPAYIGFSVSNRVRNCRKALS